MDDSIESEDSPEGVAETLRSLAAQFETGERLRIAEGERAAVAELADVLSVETALEREPEGIVEFDLEVEWSDPSRGHAGAEDATETTDRLPPDPEGLPDDPDGKQEAGATPAEGSLATFQLFRDRADEWRWRLRHHNGNVIASSGEGYTSKQNAKKGLRSVVRNAPGAEVVELDPTD